VFEEPLLRRLFSSFARGWPGVGLLLIRMIVAIALLDQAVTRLRAGTLIGPGGLAAVGVVPFLIIGLWTPVVAALVAIAELWNAFSQTGDPRTHILLASISAALALLGPGAWSVDAHVFGWKRIDIGDRQG
jgi:uncharacterized membrane protein YphA (DoxX/SURF4 family)